jgi:hypothetical protein
MFHSMLVKAMAVLLPQHSPRHGEDPHVLCPQEASGDGAAGSITIAGSSPLSRTTYFFTEISFAVMIASVARLLTKANH